MNAKELAGLLNGREYREEMTKDEEAAAKAAGLVVLFGASDDLAEFRGAINDEVGAYNGAEIFVNQKGPLAYHEDDCGCDFCGYKTAKAGCGIIEARWCPPGDKKYSWDYVTDIPHETFDIMEGEEAYCRGIVFALKDLKP